MKRSTLLKMALVVTAMFVFTSNYAQILTVYSEDNTVAMYQTVGTNFRLYVKPDPVYSPSYDASTNGSINSNSYWMFTITAGLTAVTPNSLTSPIHQNWVELNATTTGSQTVTAAEQWGASGCQDATPQSLTVNVVDAPTATLPADPAVRCTDAVGLGQDAVSVSITEDVLATLANYAFAVTEKVENWDDVNGTNSTTLSTSTIVDHKVSAKAAATGTQPNYNITFNTSNLAIQNSKVTVYTYTLVKASDAPGTASDGIVSTVSHKSDYIGGTVSTYPFGAKKTYVAIVAPTPSTGPIYHIPNDFTF